MSLSYWSESLKDKKEIQCDVCIVGAGISGLSTAYWLKKKDPQLNIYVVDKSTLGDGATGRNAGFVTCGSVEHFNRMVGKHGEKQALDIWRFAEENKNLLEAELKLSEDSSLEYEQKGAFSLAAQENEFEELKNVSEFMMKHKIPVEVLDETAVSSRLGAQGFKGGILYKKDAAINPIKLLKKIRANTEISLLENQEVKEVKEEGSERLVIAKDYSLRCSLVVFCANGYSSALNNYFEDKIFPTRGQIMVMSPQRKFMEGPCYANFYLDYFRQLQDGSLLIGGFRQLEADTEKGFSDHTSEKIQSALHDFVIKHLPEFKNSQITHRWSGVMGFSVDGEPMIGSLPTDPQIFYCGGFTGHGLGMAFHTGLQLSRLIFGEEIPDWISGKRF